jgi:hypothetical protein
MRNAQVAEWILSLVTSPERATSTVGDLMENAPNHGRFWLGVLRTAVSLQWSDVAINPGRMARLAGGAFLVGMVLIFVCILAIIPLAMALRPGDPNVWASWAFNIPSVLAVMILVPFQQGRWLARHSPGQELAPCLAVAMLTAAVDAVAAGFGGVTVFQIVLTIALPSIPMFAGAVWVRRKRLSH